MDRSLFVTTDLKQILVKNLKLFKEGRLYKEDIDDNDESSGNDNGNYGDGGYNGKKPEMECIEKT